jgi:DNA-binding NarL/FixJ family response regulator
MPSHEDRGSDFISIVVSDTTRIHTQLLADAMHGDPSLHVVASASRSKDLLDAVARVPIDVAVISYGLDDHPGRGPELLREMRQLRPQIKGVVLLDSSKPQVVLDCFRAGAKGIFSKHDKLESLRKCIRCVHEGQIWASSIELEHVLEALNNSPRVCATNHAGIELLSARERQVVEYLAAGMTNREIAKALGLSPHTVKNYLFRIFDKLGVSSRTELLYLTMNNQLRDSGNRNGDGNGDGLAAVVEAAQSGDPSAQLRLAEHYCNVSPGDGDHQDMASAYMWYLVAANMAAPLLDRIEEGKKNLRQTLSPQQVAEAERRAAEWLAGSKKKPGFDQTAKDADRSIAAIQ